MAWTPCCLCDQRFGGEALNLYLSIYFGDEREPYRFVVCQPCAEHLLEAWREKALRRGADGEWNFVSPGTPPERLTAGSERQERPQKGRAGR